MAPGWRRILALAWYPSFVVSLLIFGAAVILMLTNSPQTVTQSHLVFEDTAWNRGIKILTYMGAGFSSVVSITLAALVFRKKSATRIGLFLSFYLLAYGVLLAGPIEFLQPLWPAAPMVNSFILLPIFTGPVTMTLFAIFPDGTFVPAWSRWLVLLSALTLPASFLVVPEGIPNLLGSTSPFVLALLVAFSLAIFLGAVTSQVHRYRNVSTAVQRQQTKWVLYGMVLWLVVMIVSSFSWLGAFMLPAGSLAPWWLPLGELGWVLSTVFLPVALSVSILRHQLLNIDTVINRTLVYGALTGGVLALYALVVVAAGLIMQSNSEWAGVLITAVATAVFFRPLKLTLQRGADRLIAPSPGQDRQAGEAQPVGARPDRDTVREVLATDDPDAAWIRISRALWYPLAAVGFVVFLGSLPGHVLQLTTIPHSAGAMTEPWSPAFMFNLLSAVLSVFASGLSLALAGLLFWKRSRELMAVILSFFLLAHGVIIAGPLESLEPFIPGIADFSVAYVAPTVVGPLTIALLALFPDGKFVPNWTRWVVLSSILFVPLSIVVGHPDMGDSLVAVLTLILYVLFFGTGFSMVYAQVHRHRTVSDPVQRQQGKWFVYGFAMWLGLTAVSSIPYLYLDTLPPGTPPPTWASGLTAFWWLSTAVLPVALTVAIMRYRLYEIDLIINRTLVYGALTASVVAIYALVVGGLGILFQSSGNLVVSLVATGLVAVLFQPLRQRLQQGVNRLTYGDREDPVSVLTSLGRQLEETISPGASMDGIVRTVAHQLKLPFAAIEFEAGADYEEAVTYGRRPLTTVSFPIVYQTELIGRLVVGPRSADEELGEKDKVLLETVARQAGAAVKAARLADDLQRSRQQLVTAREEERRRLRRDLHDGLGPQLASQTLTLDALERRLQSDPESAAALLKSLKGQARDSIRDIRRLVYDLRPPALDELGLSGALREIGESHRQDGLVLAVDAAEELPKLPAAVEVAAFRIAQEAITNVVRHANASRCQIRISLEGSGEARHLLLMVEDDGEGITPDDRPGVGLHSMRERAEELGGRLACERRSARGTRLLAWLPLPADDDK